MVDIVNYKGKKALLIDSKDIIDMNIYIKSKPELDLIAKIETARHEVECILLVTSIKPSIWPRWLRNILNSMSDSTVPCYRYFFVNDHLMTTTQEDTE